MIKTYFAGEIIPENEPYAYVIAKDGFYMVKRNGLFESCVWVETLPDVPGQEETFVLKAKKIPFELIKQVLAFFYAVYQQHRSEAMVLLCYEEDNWSIYVPEQQVAGGRVDYRNDCDKRVVGSIHSHPTFGLGASNTDDQDEANFDGFHIIISKFDDVNPELAVYAVVNGRRLELDPEGVIERLNEPIKSVNPEWLKMVKPIRETLFEREPGATKLVELPQNSGDSREKMTMPEEEQCFFCSHGDVCVQDMLEEGQPCEFFDYSKEKAVAHQRLLAEQKGGVKL